MAAQASSMDCMACSIRCTTRSVIAVSHLLAQVLAAQHRVFAKIFYALGIGEEADLKPLHREHRRADSGLVVDSALSKCIFQFLYPVIRYHCAAAKEKN